MRVRAVVVGLVVACLASAACACSQASTSSARAVPVSPGCGRGAPVPAGQSVTRALVSGGVQRSYLLRLPADYQPRRPRWLVLSFHGHKRTSAYQEELTGLSATDAIVVYPQGLVGSDGQTAWSGAPYSAAVDDVRFTADLIDTLRGELCVDPARVYATGKSNGGGFVGLLACRLSDRIAAFAPVSGAFYSESGPCDPPRPASIVDFHGTADTTIPYQGSPGKGLPTLPGWLAGWAARDACAMPPDERVEHNGVVQVSRWRPCGQGAEIVHYRIAGLGHSWPSTRPNLDAARPTVLDATPIIMEFFGRHPLADGRH